MIIAAILLGLLLGGGAGWEAHHLHVRAIVGRLYAANTAITHRQHRADAIAYYARKLHVHPRGIR